MGSDVFHRTVKDSLECLICCPLLELPWCHSDTGRLTQSNNSAGNTLCAHGRVVVDGDSVFVCAKRWRARDLLRSGHSGPKTIADLMAANVPRPCAVCTTSLQWTQRSFGFHVFHWCASRTSWCLQAGAPEASWPRSAFPASYHRGEHKSRTPVT